MNFDESLIDLFKEVRLMQNNKIVGIAQYIVSRSLEHKNNYPFAIALQDAFRTFTSSCD